MMDFSDIFPTEDACFCNGPLVVNPFLRFVTAGVMLLYGVSVGLPPDGV